MKCIYCGDTSGLSDEHIVPDGLGGKNVLRNASCHKHRDITSKFELKIMRGHWMAFRINAKLIKRINRHDRNIYATKIIGDYRERLKVLPKEYPILLLPVFDVVGWPNELSVDVVPYAKTMQQVANPGFRNHNGLSYSGLETRFEYAVNFSVDDFIRFATKIAYCQCFAE